MQLARRRSGWIGHAEPLISVIIPTHNRCELLLERALPSVLEQTHKNMQVIVADHGSTDNTVDKLLSAFGQDSRINTFGVRRTQTYPPTAENHWLVGPVAPLNIALRYVLGDWIARIDDDDVWTPDHLEKLLEFAEAGDYEFVSSAHRTHEGAVDPYWDEAHTTRIGGVQTWLYRSYLKFMKYNPDCWRKAWNRVNDTDLQDRMFRAGVRMGYLDLVTAYVYPRPGETEVGSKAYLEDTIKKERELSFS